ncbi:signal transduction histidine kinase [Nocardia tenerifensis]|uniref:histidine kinase n=1 Tax=Nocardia tenerifensis TaxID=228006 RepID=A0A318K1J1_9NOCA|nr:HAMP domain-containing sensor histidine kinase [Nocardia tenerifensis]PXX61545.1 signal transduction histidine kinase [Nocardia tenerifensis]
MKRQSTIRVRLTLLYAGAFFLAGAILIALMYFYLNQSLERRPGVGATRLVREYLAERAGRRPVSEDLYEALTRQAEQHRRDTLRAMLVWALVSLGAVGLAAGGFGWLLAGRALRPLQKITATARRVADRSLHERIALTGPDDEIKDLADTFDAMLERLDRAFDGQRRFVANASHELRTPLTINRTLIEVAMDDPAAPEATRRLGATLLEVNRRNERLIDGLLVLASSEQRLTEHTPVDLADIAARATTVADDAAAQADVRIGANLTAAPVTGDPVLLEQLAQNLLDNAVRYNRAAGWVSVTTRVAGDRAELIVENTGPRVPPFEVDGLFEPFRRLAPDRVADSGNAGLGLSIVRSVAQAHGGTVRATARADGGLTVTVSLPIHRAG